MTDHELLEIARDQLKLAYAPYSGFHVGAALLTKSGKVYTGVNVENASYGATICAERTACVKAVSEGEREFEALAVACSADQASMCGICRQFMSEFSTDIRIITDTKEGPGKGILVRPLSSLLPDDFKL